jgi:hypothetical protein
MVARIAGTVMKGPVPTMFDMLIETAFSNPNLRGSRACGSPAYAGPVPVFAVTREVFLREEDARILQIVVDDQTNTPAYKAPRGLLPQLPAGQLRGKAIAPEN